jgi:hypothetical protein
MEQIDISVENPAQNVRRFCLIPITMFALLFEASFNTEMPFYTTNPHCEALQDSPAELQRPHAQSAGLDIEPARRIQKHPMPPPAGTG